MIESTYIHIPFCKELCHYCDFNKVYITKQPVDTYIEMLNREMALTFQGMRPKMKTVYIGGGTPTALSLLQLRQLLKNIHRQMEITSETEFTIEGNPNDFSQELVTLLLEFGINRVSLGAQTFHACHLKQMNRTHTPKQIETAISYLFTNGLNNINVDLIYGYPNHEMKHWKETLEKIVTLPIQHISAYSLIVEPKTKFYFMDAKGELELPEEDMVAEMYEEAMFFLPKHNFKRYELSNYAKTGFESKHNLVYWNNDFYYGFGAGAHSYIHFNRIQNFAPIMHYIKALQNEQLPRLNIVTCTKQEQMEEEMFLGLRKAAGVCKEQFFQKFKQQISDVFDKSVADGKKRGLLMESSSHIFLTEKGCLLGNEVFEQFLFEKNNL